MKQRLSIFLRWLRGPACVPLVSLGLGILSYGLLAPRLGFYWDDYPLTWIRVTYGNAGLARYFSTNRPVWGLLFQATAWMLGEDPLRTQLFGLFWRWLAAVSFWQLVWTVWTERRDLAAWSAAAFMVFPAFSQQFIGLVYGHFFIVLTAFFLSLWMSVRAAQAKSHKWIWTVSALLLSVVNLLMMEYFFLLELIRPLLLWLTNDNETDARLRRQRTMRSSLPYLLLFLGAVIWRAFFFTYQTQNYEVSLLAQLMAAPWLTLQALVGNIGESLWNSALGGWLLGFRMPDPAVLGQRTMVLWGAAIAAGAILTGWLAFALKDETQNGSKHSTPLWMMMTGLVLLVLAGPPFWLTNLPVELHFPVDRFTLAFAPGACLLLAGLLGLINHWRWLPRLMLTILIALAVGVQVQNASAYRREWDDQQALFWQMAWRMPQLKPGTIVISNDLPMLHWSDNSLTAPLNWVYADGNTRTEMSYLWYYATVRQNTTLPQLKAGLVVKQDYLAASFTGNSSQSVAVYYAPPACLRVLDAEVEGVNGMLTPLMRDAAALSNLSRIQSSAEERPLYLPASLFGSEPAHQWCYYFETADLARQNGDWQQVADLGDVAFSLEDSPNDPAERLPFIEGYAHVGRWSDALEVSRKTLAITPLMQPVLCRLWARIDANTQPTAEKTNTMATVQADLACPAP